MSADWRDWLGHEGSLSDRLMAASGGRFRVEVLRQHVGQPSRDESTALGMMPRRWALIREVRLWGASAQGHPVPWVYARSVLPLTTLTGPERALRYLNTRPLGSILFSAPTMKRAPLEAAQIATAALPRTLALAPGTLWARRSVFFLGASGRGPKPLLVAEFFLPGFDPTCG